MLANFAQIDVLTKLLIEKGIITDAEFKQKLLEDFLMVRPGIEQVGDLRNKAVGISTLGSTTHLVADVIARRHGLTPGKDLHLLPSGDDQGRFASLETGRVDAVIGSTPLDVWGAKKNYKIIARAKDYTNLPQNAVNRVGYYH